MAAFMGLYALSAFNANTKPITEEISFSARAAAEKLNG